MPIKKIAYVFQYVFFILCATTAILFCEHRAAIAEDATTGDVLVKRIAELEERLIALANSRIEDSRTIVPLGTVVAYLGEIDLAKGKPAPKGWLLCDGQTTLDKPEYADLKKALGCDKVPNLQGYFLRGLDPTGNIDSEGKGRIVSSPQPDLLASHNHGGNTGANGNHDHGAKAEHGDWRKKNKGSGGLIMYADGEEGCTPTGFDSGANDKEICIERIYPIPASGNHPHSIPREGGSETRPKNIAVNWIIKF